MTETPDYLNSANPAIPEVSASTRGVGRPTVVTPEVLQKLETAYAFGATDEEACFLGDISPSTLYNYQNANPEFLERKIALKQRPVLLARKSVVEGLQSDPKLALDYLRNTRRHEFSTRVENKNTNYDGMSLIREEEIEGVAPENENPSADKGAAGTDPAGKE